MKKAIVTGAGGFIGHHLVKKLKQEGYWVRGVDVKLPEFESTTADEFMLLDLRESINCKAVVGGVIGGADEVFNLAADMGGMGFIHSAECDIMHNNALINLNMVDAGVKAGVKKYFFSSSVCVYPDMRIGDDEIDETGAYPALPDNEYGWEKLFSERMLLANARNSDMEAKIARFQNTYGTLGTWQGGREKAPAALSRKVVEAVQNKQDYIEVWGDGQAVRSYTYIDDLIDGIFLLMQSNITEPVNIGSPEYYSVDELAKIIMKVAGVDLRIRHIVGPVGVQSRNFSNNKIYSTGWKSKWSLEAGISETYNWIKEQVAQSNL